MGNIIFKNIGEFSTSGDGVMSGVSLGMVEGGGDITNDGKFVITDSEITNLNNIKNGPSGIFDGHGLKIAYAKKKKIYARLSIFITLGVISVLLYYFFQ